MDSKYSREKQGERERREKREERRKGYITEDVDVLSLPSEGKRNFEKGNEKGSGEKRRRGKETRNRGRINRGGVSSRRM